MAIERVTHKILLALACCLALVLVPAMAGAQEGVIGKVGHGIKKGAHEVQKGVETGVEKTKEGVESVGDKTKRVVTGDDNTSADRQKPTMQSTTPSGTTTTKSTTSKSTTKSRAERAKTEGTKGGKPLPGTADDLPLLALVGSLALAGAVAWKLVRRTQ